MAVTVMDTIGLDIANKCTDKWSTGGVPVPLVIGVVVGMSERASARERPPRRSHGTNAGLRREMKSRPGPLREHRGNQYKCYR